MIHGLRRALSAVYFLFHFLGLFLKANLEVAKLVLFVPNQRIISGFIDYDLQEMRYGEAILLSQCITLTPGTISAVFDWERKRLRIHVLDLVNPEDVKRDIDRNLKQEIWKFTR